MRLTWRLVGIVVYYLSPTLNRLVVEKWSGEVTFLTTVRGLCGGKSEARQMLGFNFLSPPLKRLNVEEGCEDVT